MGRDNKMQRVVGGRSASLPLFSDKSENPERRPRLVEELARLTNPSAYDTTYLTHGLHSYAAKYIPQIPQLILKEHTNERHRVLDPFCGSGTTLLEAAILGRKSVGVDCHPIAALVSRAKSTALNAEQIARIIRFAESLRAQKSILRVPKQITGDKQLRHWFPLPSIEELFRIRHRIKLVNDEAVRDFLHCVLSSIIVQVSYQESETRYAAVPKKIRRGDTTERFCQKLQKSLGSVIELSRLEAVRRNRPQVITGDIRSVGPSLIGDESVDLIVTSPPYPNSYDYYLYHKWRLWWLGIDHAPVRNSEIGSRYEHSSQKASIESYIEKMRDALSAATRTLKPSKLAYLLVGDAVVRGNFCDMREVFARVTCDLELELVDSADYALGDVSRSFREKTSDGCHGGRRHPAKRQHVLVYQKIRKAKRVFSGRAQAVPAAITPISELEDAPNAGTVALRSNENARHIHSLGRYPSKFIPDIPRWAIREFSRPGDLVLDPFVGSGTTSVEAVVAGRNAVGADVSAYACLLTRAKSIGVGSADLEAGVEAFSRLLTGAIAIPEANPPKFDLSDFWFPAGHLEQLAGLKSFIVDRVPFSTRDFFLAILATAIRPSSYQDEAQIKVKRDPKKVAQGVPEPITILRHNFSKHVARFREFLRLRDSTSTSIVLNQSADSLLSKGVAPQSVDVIVTSPPYINAMNYPMTHRYENFVLGLLEPQRKTLHESEYIGTERVYARDFKAFQPLSMAFERKGELEGVLREIFLSEPKRSFVARSYFMRMSDAVAEMHSALKPGGRLVLVLGRNTIRQVPVDTFGYLVSIAEAKGFTLDKWFNYEIIKNVFKITRHQTAAIIALDGVAILSKAV